MPIAEVVLSEGAGARWHVLHTLSRQEKALSRDLGVLGIEHYLPLQESVRYYGRRKIRFDLPVFAGYVFVRGTIEQAFDADRTGRVARIIRVADQDQFERELAQIRRALEAGMALTPYQTLAPGTMVRVRHGPLCGIAGEVEERGKSNRLILRIRTLGQAVSLEIDAELLEAAESVMAA